MPVVQRSKELTRIRALPVRTELIDPEEVSALFRRGLSGSLRPLQAQALFEAWQAKGGLFPLGVGVGKTLITLLLPTVFRSVRPLLLVPAKLVEKTKRDQRTLSPTWKIVNHIRIESYELLGRISAAKLLEHYKPDLIVADECHKLRNFGAGVTKRVRRWMSANPATVFVGLSGTITKRNLTDYAHLLEWALGELHSPLPKGYNEIREWDAFLGGRPYTSDPGALVELLAPEDSGDVKKAFARRLTSTVGVVASVESPCDSSLVIETLPVTRPPEVEKEIERFNSSWIRADGWALTDAKDMWRIRRQLNLGFYYRWDPEPPKAWLEVRREWAKRCRDILSTNRRGLDTALAVTQAIDRGLYPEAVGELEAWRAIKPTFRPNTVPVWLDRFVAPVVKQFLEGRPAIVWCEHDAVANMIADALELRVYGEKGFANGRYYIDDHPTDWPMVAMLGSNLEGRNLQHWSESLVLSPPPNGVQWEQLIGRTHRPGQASDEVRYTVLGTGCDALEKAREDAAYIESTTGQPQKLLRATYV